ncbi:MAG: serine hydrolase [Acidobacteriaceae bacterium]
MISRFTSLRRPHAKYAGPRLIISLVGLLVALAGAATARVQNIAPQAEYQAVGKALSNMVQHEIADKKIPAISIALVDGQTIVWAQGFGYADPDKKVAATAETVYRVGSVSKLFTDIGVMQLVERGELNLDSPIQTYLPNFHPKNKFDGKITLRELMSHRSGLLREPPVGNYFETSEPTLEATVLSLNNTELVYAPGTHAKYSNAGVAVAGYALQVKAGRPFAPYLKQTLLQPMGMTSSSFLPEPALIGRLAKAYMWSYDGLNFAAPTFQLGMAPAGSMYSTVTDLGRFASVLFAHGMASGRQVIKPETLDAMWKPQYASGNETLGNQKSGYGLGFGISEQEGHRTIGHDGAIYGFASSFKAMPDDQIAAIAIATKDSSNAVTDHIVREALRLMLAARAHQPLPEIEETVAIPDEMVARLKGHYGERNTGVDLKEQFGELFLLPDSGGYQVRLRRQGNDLIVDDALSYGTTLKAAGNGITIGGETLQKTQVEKPEPPSEQIGALLGEYGWDHDKLYMLEKGGKLTALIEWFEFDPLTQRADEMYGFPDHGLYDGERAEFSPTQVKVSGATFKRRPIGAGNDGIFRIKPVKPVPELRKEALAAKPPAEKGDFLQPHLVELTSLDPSIKLDVRYATSNNFLSTPVYTEEKAYMQRPAAEAVARVSRGLKGKGYGLIIHDAYRPWYVTKIFWDATPPSEHIFVADPAEGSRHNRGCAVDLSLYDLATGKELEMTGVYDEMSERSYAYYPGGTSLERWQRDLLRDAMESEGFKVYPYEWWHFDYKDWQKYPIDNQTFEELSRR